MKERSKEPSRFVNWMLQVLVEEFELIRQSILDTPYRVE